MKNKALNGLFFTFMFKKCCIFCGCLRYRLKFFYTCSLLYVIKLRMGLTLRFICLIIINCKLICVKFQCFTGFIPTCKNILNARYNVSKNPCVIFYKTHSKILKENVIKYKKSCRIFKKLKFFNFLLNFN